MSENRLNGVPTPETLTVPQKVTPWEVSLLAENVIELSTAMKLQEAAHADAKRLEQLARDRELTAANQAGRVEALRMEQNRLVKLVLPTGMTAKQALEQNHEGLRDYVDAKVKAAK